MTRLCVGLTLTGGKKHPNGGKDSLNFEDALKAIMKATGAKMDKKDKDKKEGEE